MGYKDYSQDLTEAVYDLISGISADVFIHQATETPVRSLRDNPA
jgi:hypothetical protein